jgi:hypothetical protein
MIFDYIAKQDFTQEDIQKKVLLSNKENVETQRVIDFLEILSKQLLSKDIARLHPELVPLGFFLRRSEISRIKPINPAAEKKILTVPKGMVFHVPPANVDTIFVYSWVLSLLSGNKNVVRVSERSGPAARAIISKIQTLFTTDFKDLAKTQIFIGIPRGDDLFTFLSANCDLRVLWGGDRSIDELRRYPLDPRATDLTFPDRSSFACLNSQAVNSLNESDLATLALKFVNDAWWFDQAACSSPKMIYWIGESEQNQKAKQNFFSAVSRHLEAENIGTDPAMSKERLVRLTKVAMTEECTLDFSRDRVALASTTSNPREWHGAGSFIEVQLASLDEIVPHVQKRDQTMAYFGFSTEQLHKLVNDLQGRGLDRLVPIGDALSFSAIWDGYDLVESFSRKVTIS